MVTRLKFVIMCRNLHQELKSIDENLLPSDIPNGPPEESDALKTRMKVKAITLIFISGDGKTFFVCNNYSTLFLFF